MAKMSKADDAWSSAASAATELGKAFDDLNAVLAKQYEVAKREDPGLEQAVREAQERDPDIGWLDVCAERERRR